MGVEETQGQTVWSTMVNVAAKEGDTEVFREVQITGQEQVGYPARMILLNLMLGSTFRFFLSNIFTLPLPRYRIYNTGYKK